MLQRCAPILVALAALALVAPTRAQGPASDAVARALRAEAPRPRLVVVLSIDQLRADYLTRFADLFLPAEENGSLGGFRYLMSRGAWFVDARFEHLPLYTAPGHAVIMTGAQPSRTGIVGNDWWDAAAQRPVYCVADPRFTVVGAGEGSRARPMGPANLRSTTVGDEIKLATDGRAKVITLAIKDRAAILLGGHAQDLSLWYDTAGGRWISSTAYCRAGSLPAWVEELNNEQIPDRMLGKEWTPSVSQEVLEARTIAPSAVGFEFPASMGKAFPHPVGAEKTGANYFAFIFTPAANAFVFETARRAVDAEKLGQDETPDILAISLSSNDYVGHAFGPYSPEVLDITVQTDRQLAAFINELQKSVPGGMKSVVFVLTADHGAGPVPEDAGAPAFDLPGGRFRPRAVLDTISTALTSRFGEPAGGKGWFARNDSSQAISGAWLDGFIYLHPAAVAGAISSGKAGTRRDVERAACDAVNNGAIPGVYGCYGKTQILEGEVADGELKRALANGVHPALSADLIVVWEQLWLQDAAPPRGHAASHGTPYPYDAQVPLVVCAPGLVKPGVYTERVAPSGIAPTLSVLLGVGVPSGCEGRVLPVLGP